MQPLNQTDQPTEAEALGARKKTIEPLKSEQAIRATMDDVVVDEAGDDVRDRSIDEPASVTSAHPDGMAASELEPQTSTLQGDSSANESTEQITSVTMIDSQSSSRKLWIIGGVVMSVLVVLLAGGVSAYLLLTASH